MLHWFCLAVLCTTKTIRLCCQDETRIGLKTITGRKITAKGVKPVGEHQWQLKATYLYGIIEPLTGESFFWEFSDLNTDCFQIFLNLVSQHFADSVLIIQLDNGAFHKSNFKKSRNYSRINCSCRPIVRIISQITPTILGIAPQF